MSDPRTHGVLEALAHRYRVEREIGRGGMATVLLASDEQLARSVAIKVLDTATGPDGAERFRREVDLVARLQHPNIVPVYDAGVLDGRPYFVMPYVAGESLRARFAREGALPMADVVRLTEDLAAGLDHAHAQGVLHRDVKPENVLLSEGRAIVADFGIALASASPGDRITGTGLIVGTPAYMSPEQASGDRRLDARTDVYALACITYEALAGHPPFSGSSAREVIARHLADPPPSLRTARPDLPAAVERTVLGALAKSPADRPRSAGEFARLLRTAAEAPDTAEREQAARRTRKRTMGLLLAAGVLAAAAVGVFRVRQANAFEPRDRLVVSSLQLDPVDPALAEGLRSALLVALEQSAHVNVLHRQDMLTTLRMMHLPDTTTFGDSVSREVALRTGAKAVLLPRVRRTAEGWTVELAAEVPTSRRPLAVERATVATEEAVLQALGQLAARLRRALGEPLREGEAGVPIEMATTSSLDALKAWSEGTRHFDAGRYQPAVLAFREAVRLDTAFAMAYKSLGVTLYWVTNRLAGDSAFARALAFKDRLSERERLLIEADIANWRSEGSRAINLYRRVLERFPDDRGSQRALAYALLRQGEYEEAVTAYAAIVRSDSVSFGPRLNLAASLAALGRYPEAVEHYRRAFQLDTARLTSGQPLVQEYAMVLAEAGQRDSAFAVVRRASTGSALSKRLALRLAGMLMARDGMGDSAASYFRESWASAGDAGAATAVRNGALLARVLLWSGRTADARAVLAELRAAALNPRIDPFWPRRVAQLAWAAGDVSLARATSERVLEAVDPRNFDDLRSSHLIRAEQALAAGALDRAAASADSAAVTGGPNALGIFMQGRTREAMGQRAEAERYFMRAAEMHRCCGEEYFEVTEARVAAARLAAARGDTATALARMAPLLAEWRRGDTTFVAHRWALGLGAPRD